MVVVEPDSVFPVLPPWASVLVEMPTDGVEVGIDPSVVVSLVIGVMVEVVSVAAPRAVEEYCVLFITDSVETVDPDGVVADTVSVGIVEP